MFTKQRFKPPQITGDASKDVYELGLAIAKYLRTLEDKGALTLDQATIDGTTVGATSPGTGSFTTLGAGLGAGISPAAPLHAKGGTNPEVARFEATSGNPSITFNCGGLIATIKGRGDLSNSLELISDGVSTLICNNGAVGINGVTSPTTALEVNGVISLRDAGTRNRNAGLVTESGASIIEFGVNDDSGNRFGGAYTSADQGGFLRFDTRAGNTLMTVYGRAAASVAGVSALLTMDSAGQLQAASSITSAAGLMQAPLGVKCDNTSATNTVWMGYTTRATKTQLTSKATATTCNGQVCRITMNGAALAAGTIVSFVLTNSAISNAGNENWFAFHESGGTLGAYTVTITPTGLSTATVTVRNNTGGSLSEAIVIGLVKFGG
jgi:hypothetical protein